MAFGGGVNGLATIDWAAPWLAPWRTTGQACAAHVAAGHSVAQALNACNATRSTARSTLPMPTAPVQFVPQADLPAGSAYEQHIFDTARVPTRDGLHDFFNGLCWLQFPRTKARLNHLQAAQIAASGIAPVRGPARDALTLFDENAALLIAPDSLWLALLAKDWQAVFGSLRPLWAQAHLVLFGHALLEKLVQPRKAITAHVFRAHSASPALGAPPLPTLNLAELDAWLAQALSAPMLAAKPFAHLPVLGVPGWWPANGQAAFYADSSVFRAASRGIAAGAGS